MTSIYSVYFTGKIIFLVLISIIGYAIYNKSIPKWILVVAIPFFLFVGYFTFSGPSIFNNVKLYNKLQSITANDVKEIEIFNIDLRKKYNPIPNTLYTLRKKEEIASIIAILQQSKTYTESMDYIDRSYGLSIILKDSSEIDFEILKTRSDIYLSLLNEINNKYYTIGNYKSNAISKFLIE